VPNVLKICYPKLPGTLWATPGLLRVSFTFTYFHIFKELMIYASFEYEQAPAAAAQ
jgi:hypothetical protein